MPVELDTHVRDHLLPDTAETGLAFVLISPQPCAILRDRR